MKNNKISIAPSIKFSLILLSLLILFSFTACDDDPNGTPTYGVSLSQTTLHTFTAQTVGYGAQTPFTVTVTNTGSEPTGNLTVALSGENEENFTLSKESLESIAVGGNNTFTVVPKPDLEAKTYTATVTVSGDNITSVSFDISFTVNPPNVEYWNVIWHLHSGTWAGEAPPIQIVRGEPLSRPTDPIRKDSSENSITFGGWYTDKNFTDEYAFDTPVTKDITLYAKWPPMFWWGNYIPSTEPGHLSGVWTISSSAVFNLEELVEHRENARRRVSLTGNVNAGNATQNNAIIHQDGTMDVYNSQGVWLTDNTIRNEGDLRWQEFKHWEVAVKENRTITFTSNLGFVFFISPAEFGDIIVMEPDRTPVNGYVFHLHKVNINDVPYNVYQHNRSLVTTPISYIFEFTN